jgi:hypothetical protein
MNTSTSILVFVLTLLIGVIFGWIIRYVYDEVLDTLYKEPHPYEHIFNSNPHPELYDNNGDVFMGDYITAKFDEDPWAYEYGMNNEEDIFFPETEE